MGLTVETVAGPDELAARAVQLLEDYGAECMAARGRLTVSLAGGSTPKAVYRLWGKSSGLDWAQVHLYFGDERCVPPDHPDSNAGMVEANLLQQLRVRPVVHRMAGEHPQPAEAAADYERALREGLGGDGRLDLALLGIGSDGHTASLFPGGAAATERERLCVAAPAPDGKMERLTLTAPALGAARRILFMAAGAGKAEILHEVVRGPVAPGRLPAQLFLRDEALEVTLLLDEAAAGRL